MSSQVESDAEIRQRVERRLRKRGEFFIHLSVFLAVNLVLWIAWMLLGGGFAWPMLLTIPWGAGLAAHGTEVSFETGGRAVARERAIHDAMRQIYGDEWSVTASQEDYNRVRWRVVRAANKRREFFMHLSVYIPINLLLWLVWLQFGGWPWPALLTLGWGLGLFAHAVDTYLHGVTAREQAIQREMEREREQLYGGEKGKRKRSRLVIADDGELMEVIEDEDTVETRRH